MSDLTLIPPVPQDSGPYISFENVSKAFGDNRVLDGVSFQVNAGETVCILGRSGVGKSVSLHNIMMTRSSGRRRGRPLRSVNCGSSARIVPTPTRMASFS